MPVSDSLEEFRRIPHLFRMSVTVYQLEHSPYCIPITRALEALHVPFAVRNVANGTRREVIELTGGAYYQVPVLEHDGKVIHESGGNSTDIAHYVDRTFAGGKLFPKELEGLQNIIVPYIENEIEGVTFKLIDPYYVRSLTDPVDRLMVIRHKERKFGAGCEDAWEKDRDNLMARAVELVRPFDQMLAQHRFLLADAPVFSDFALFGVLGNMTYREVNPLPPGLPALADWHARMKTFKF